VRIVGCGLAIMKENRIKMAEVDQAKIKTT
jgi:hypothetical protein